jgi:hypothetical protein
MLETKFQVFSVQFSPAKRARAVGVGRVILFVGTGFLGWRSWERACLEITNDGLRILDRSVNSGAYERNVAILLGLCSHWLLLWLRTIGDGFPASLRSFAKRAVPSRPRGL